MYRHAARAAVITGPWQTVESAAAKRASERRKSTQDADALRVGLTPAQVMTLEALEIFHWRLAFVRRPLFQAPIPVLFDRDHTRHVVIQEDGTLDESQSLVLRA